MINNNKKKGIITIAQGKKKYIDMAVNLAISIKLNSPGIPLAVITDSEDKRLTAIYDYIIPINEENGIGLTQKLHIHEYSCFDETLFIDADSLVVRSIDFIFELFSSHEISCFGNKRTEGLIWGVDSSILKRMFNIEYIIGHNGGVYYFKNKKKTQLVFEKANNLLIDYDKIGIARHRGHINEEPLLALAMSIYSETPVDDFGKGMYTHVGQHGVYKIDSLKEICEFYKYEKKVTPAIMHFGGSCDEIFHYQREIKKLHLVYNYKMPRGFTSFVINSLYNPIRFLYVFFYRITKKIVKGGKLKFRPWMPIYRFE